MHKNIHVCVYVVCVHIYIHIYAFILEGEYKLANLKQYHIKLLAYVVNIFKMLILNKLTTLFKPAT